MWWNRCAGLSPEEPTICTNVSVDADAGEEGCRNCTKVRKANLGDLRRVRLLNSEPALLAHLQF